MDRQVRPVEQWDERRRRRRLRVRGQELAGLLQSVLGGLDLRVAAGLDQVKVGGRDQQVLRALRRDRGAHHLVRLVTERQAVLRLHGPRLVLGVVEGPLVERHHRLPRLLDHLLPELDGLGEDDLLLGGQQRDLADLLEIHPDRVVDADHVGREGLELLGRRLLDLLRVELRRSFGGQTRGGLGDASFADDRLRRVSSVASSARRAGRDRRRPSLLRLLRPRPSCCAMGAGRRAWPLRDPPSPDGVG